MIKSLIQNNEINWEKINLKRNEFLLKQGDKERYFYYVISGALRAYTFINEEELTIRFAYKGSIVASIPAYFSGEASELSIQAIRKCSLLRIRKKELETYIEAEKSRLIFYNQMLVELVTSFYHREIDLLTQSPSDRIERIRKRSPQVFQEIPHKYIASYLRMSAETLSRLLNS